MQKPWFTISRLLLPAVLALVLPLASAVRGPVAEAGPQPVEQQPTVQLSSRHDTEELVCRELRQRLVSEIASERAQCESQLASFEECRADRRNLEGVEFLTCGIGVFAGVASGHFEQPLKGKECGVDKLPNPRPECAVPACESELVELEQVVLSRHGLSTLPSC
jgi:hypothetical protein